MATTITTTPPTTAEKGEEKDYLEIDSTFRDRKLYKNSSEFTINVSQFGSTTDSTVAINPLSNAYPSYNFQNQFHLRYLVLFSFFYYLVLSIY